MRFLVTNDDGIGSVFLHELVHALRRGGHELYVVAPKSEQSWIGAAKSRNRPVRAHRIDCRAGSPDPAATLASPGKTAGSGDLALQLGCPTWVVDGTPSDAVNIAVGHLLPRGCEIDAVISGINVGLNASLGFIIASGTIAGAWEGALHGLPAIAFSQDLTTELYEELKAAHDVPKPELHATLKVSAQHAARLAPQLAAATLARSFVVHNVNFPLPCRPETEVRRTVPARVVEPGLFSPPGDDGTHRLIFRLGDDLSPPEPLTDRAALAAGHISHTVLDYKKLGQ
jgi:5'-nucleotidase